MPLDRLETWLTHALGFVLVAAGAALLLRVTLAGAVPGVLTGARLATGVQERPLRTALAVVLVAIGAPLAVLGM